MLAALAPFAPIVAAGITGGLSFFGGRQTNAMNAQQVAAQMAFQDREAQEARDYDYGKMQTQNAFNQHEADKAREWSATQAATQRDWADRLSSSAYQRATADMRAAGLNPILAYQQGGASTPGGAQATGGAASAGSGGGPGAPSGAHAVMQNAWGTAVNNAMQAARVQPQIQQLQAATENTKAHTALQEEQAKLVQAQQAQTVVNTGLQTAQTLTEAYRPGYIQAQTGHSQTGAALQVEQAHTSRLEQEQRELEVERFRNYGPPGTLPNLGASGEAILRRFGGNMPQLHNGQVLPAPGAREAGRLLQAPERGAWELITGALGRLRDLVR